MDSSQVRKAINLFFVNSEPDDLLLLYYSGHGIKKDNKLYLLTKDTQPNTLKSSAVSLGEIELLMDDIPRQEKVLILDCCYSGTAMPKKSDEISYIYNQLINKRTIMLTSSSEIQSSFELKEKGGCSIFTSKLVEGLKTGMADLDGDGKISIYELYEFIRDRVRYDMPRQSPKIYPELRQEEVFIAKNPHQPENPKQMEISSCPVCNVNRKLRAGSRFCPYCGINVEKVIFNPKKCPMCESIIPSGKSLFCSGCGLEIKWNVRGAY
jgi:hypothetical protein